MISITEKKYHHLITSTGIIIVFGEIEMRLFFFLISFNDLLSGTRRPLSL